MVFGGKNTGKSYSAIGTRERPGVLRELLKMVEDDVSMHAIEILSNIPRNLGFRQESLIDEPNPFKQ